MDALAKAASTAAGSPTLSVAAEYYETEDAGMARLKTAKPALALVPLPFYLAHATKLKLSTVAQVVEKDGQPAVTWTLVAKKGRVSSPADLAGFTIVSLAGYAPGFVKNVALAKWGALPADVTFEANGQVLSALRKAANGEKVAALLDASQAASLATLPFAADLSVVTTSPRVPGIVVCTVGAKSAETTRLVGALRKVDQTPEGRAALDAVRLSKFVALDVKALDAARAAYGPTGPAQAR